MLSSDTSKSAFHDLSETPTIETERLVLYPYTWATQEHVNWLNDQEVVRYSEQRHSFHTLPTQTAYLAAIPTDSHIWVIKRDNSDIGTLTAYIDHHNGVANMGIMIGDRSAWGKGYGAEAWKAVMDWLFAGGIRKIECGCMSANRPMWRLAEKCGMRMEAVKFDHFILDGEPADMFCFRKFAS